MVKVTNYVSALLLVAGTGFATYGKTVDENTAKKTGSNFLVSENIQGVKSADDLATAYVATGQVNGSTVADFYVFNFKNGQGYVMISADDNIIPVLSYSIEGAFDINHMAPSAKSWVEGYQNQINYVLEHSLPAQAGTADQWQSLSVANSHAAARTTAVTQLLGTIAWDQDGGGGATTEYNAQCPGTGSSKAVTGCVATAMAQVMKYWNWPISGTGAHTYTPPAGYSYTAQTADFANTVYSWSTMPLTSSNAGVALLMHHAGISVDMQYSPVESGTYVIQLESPILNCAEYALKTYWRYKRTLLGVPRDGETGGPAAMTTTAWIAMIESELNAGRPVLYSGSGSDGGHCWVCDGWNSAGLMHFNFGWSGTSNGYYSVNSIAPAALGTGGGGAGNNFNSDQCVIIGIQPDTLAANPGNIKLLSHLDMPAGSPLTYDNTFSVTAKILNANTTTFKGDFCAQVYDTLHNLVTTIQTISAQTVTAADSTSLLTFSTAGIVKMIPSYYIIHVLYRPTGSSAWTLVGDNGNFVNYNLLAINNSQTVSLYDSLHVTPASHIIVRGGSLTVNTKIADFGTANFSGTLQGVLINTVTDSVYSVQQHTGQNIYSSRYGPYAFTSSAVNAPAGLYVFAVEHQFGGTGSYYVTGSDYYENPVFITITKGLGIDPTPTVADNIAVFPNPASDNINIAMNGVQASEIRIADMQGREMQKLTPGTNQMQMTIPVGAYAPGVYLVQFQVGADVVTKKIVIAK